MDSATTHFSPKKQESASSATNKPAPAPRRVVKVSNPNSSCSSSRVFENNQETLLLEKQETLPRERLKRHREEVAGNVRIPDRWSQENLLRDWMDYSSFDNLLAPKGLASARAALIEQARRAGSQRLRLESKCY